MENESTVGKLAWHVHHWELYEMLIEPIENRIAYIPIAKPKEEIDARLHLLKLVRNPPVKLAKANSEWDKARSEWIKANSEWDKASREELAKSRREWDKASRELAKANSEWVKASRECQSEMNALHATECPNCPWDGSTIFLR